MWLAQRISDCAEFPVLDQQRSRIEFALFERFVVEVARGCRVGGEQDLKATVQAVAIFVVVRAQASANLVRRLQYQDLLPRFAKLFRARQSGQARADDDYHIRSLPQGVHY